MGRERIAACCVAVALSVLGCGRVAFDDAAALTASLNVTVVVQPWSIVNLTTAGTIDWVHWGWKASTAVNRKAGVTPRSGDAAVIQS